jgi:hypothetical protein
MRIKSTIGSICIVSAMLLFGAYVLFVRPGVHLVALPMMRKELDMLKLPEGAVSSSDVRTVFKTTFFAVAQTYRAPNATALDVLQFYQRQFEVEGWRYAGTWGRNEHSLLFCKDALVANLDVSGGAPGYGWAPYTLEIWSGDAPVPVKNCPARSQ